MRIFLWFFFIAVICTLGNGYTNKKVTRKIDISSHIVKINSAITAQSVSDEDSYSVYIDSGFEDHLSFIGAVSKNGDDEKVFAVEEAKDSTSSSKKFKIKLGKSGDKPVNFVLTTIFTHKLNPYPAEISQSEKQLVKFLGNAYFYSPYPTLSQETEVVLSSSNVLSYTQKLNPVNKQDAVITYGPFNKEIPPFAQEELSVHYENNSPFLTVTSMTRHIELSHWGNIAIEETIDAYHSGAKLKGSFSRYDYQRFQDGASSIKAFKTVLPAASKNVYYRDEIGNISTSHMREMMDSVELELRPRFPLFGGWKTQYTIGYNVPSYEYLFHKGDQYALKMRFIDHVYDDQVVDHLTVNVVLPEGVSDIRLEYPYPVKEGHRHRLKTYLDSTGRTVIVAHKANLVEQHIQEFKVYYRFSTLQMIREPLMVIAAFYLLFMAIIVYVRLDFSITKDEARESKMRVAGLLEEVQASQDKRSALYQAYEDATKKFKSSKDAAAFAAARRRIEADHRALTAQIAALQTKLRPDSVDTADKVNELQALDTKYREQVTASLQLAERLVQSKITKQQYLEAEPKISGKKTEILQKLDSIMASL